MELRRKKYTAFKLDFFIDFIFEKAPQFILFVILEQSLVKDMDFGTILIVFKL